MRMFLFTMICLTVAGCSCSGDTGDSPDTQADSQQATDRGATGASADSAEGGSAAGRDHASSPGQSSGREEKFRSRVTRVLHETLEHVEGGTSEERQLMEESWEENDEELAEILDADLSQKIRENNNPRP